MARAVALDVGNQPVHGVADAPLVAQAPLEQRGRALDRRRNALRRRVLQGHAHAAHRAYRGDVAADDAGAHHVHVAWLEIAFSEALEALLQEEDAHQILARRMRDQARDRGRIARRYGERVAAVLLPDVEDGVGHRVVLAPRLAGDLLAGLRT